MKKHLLKGICTVLAAAMITASCGCGKKELPEDTPWNHGFNAIMETEHGYYYDCTFRHNLRYHEKESDTEIYLCSKPECQHIGEETCVASYHNMPIVNAVLYEGFIYILSQEYDKDIASINLYKASLDGTSIDKVGEALSARNTTDGDVIFGNNVVADAFIIHKGYAYIPIYLTFNYSLKGFVNGGIVKMDIQSGATEQIFTMERLTSPRADNLRGCGDYVYFDITGGQNTKYNTQRYNVKDGTIEPAFGEFGRKNNLYAVGVTKEKLYVLTRSPEDKLGIGAFDSKTGEYLGTLFYPETGEECPGKKQGIQWTEVSEGQDEVGCAGGELVEKVFSRLITYQDKLIFLAKDKAVIYSDNGEKLGEMDYQVPVPMEEVFPIVLEGSESDVSESDVSESEASRDEALESEEPEKETSENEAAESEEPEKETSENEAAESEEPEKETSENEASESKVSESEASENDSDDMQNKPYTYPSGRLRFKISQDKLYAVCATFRFTDAGRYYFDIYSCPIEDILKGTGEWTLEYSPSFDYKVDSIREDAFSGFWGRNYEYFQIYALGTGRCWE